MKSKRLIIGGLFCILIGLLICWPSKRSPIISMPESPGKPVSNIPHALPPVESTSNHSHTDHTVIIQGVPISEEYLRYYEHVKADPLYDWKQPINFYGKALDERNEPVAGASVDYTWSTLAPNGTMTKHDETDSAGLFSIHETGSGIGITVTKKGYYTAPSEKLRSFEYANHGEGVFTPDPANPVIFHLQKKGAGAALIKCEQKINITLSSPITFDLKTCSINALGELASFELLNNKSGGTNKTEWIMRLGVPDGGIQFSTNEFSFLAPENDYQPYVDLTLESPRPEAWYHNGYAGGVVFLKTLSGYGKLEVRMIPGQKYFRLVSYFNPDGSPNLEPQSQ